MEKVETYKDIRTVASVSALIGVATMSIYFQNKISKMEGELQDVQKVLATIVPHIDPNSKQQLEQVIKAIKVLDSRMAHTQTDLEAITGKTSTTRREKSSKYVRLTKPSRRTSISDVEEVNEDIEDDVAAMMS